MHTPSRTQRSSSAPDAPDNAQARPAPDPSRTARQLDRRIRAQARRLAHRIGIGAALASIVLVFFGALSAISERASDAPSLFNLPPLSQDAVLSIGGVIATLVVAIQFGARFDRSPAQSGKLDEAARGAVLGVVAWVCLIASVGIALLTAYWYGWRDGHIDVTIALSALAGGAVLAVASADAMLLTEHDLDEEVSRIQGRRSWVRARAVVIFESTTPLTGRQLRTAIATACAVPLLTTLLSELTLPSSSVLEGMGRFALMSAGAAASAYAVYMEVRLLLGRNIWAGVALAVGVASLHLLVWDAALFDISGQPVESPRQMAQQLLAYAFCAATLPLVIFGAMAGRWFGRRGLTLEAAYRYFVRQEQRLREQYRSPNPTTPRGRVSANAAATVWTVAFWPLCILFLARALDEVRSASELRGRRRAVIAAVTSTALNGAFIVLLALIAFGIVR